VAKSRLSASKDKRKSEAFANARRNNPHNDRYQVFYTRAVGRKIVRGGQCWTCSWDPRTDSGSLSARCDVGPLLIVDNEASTTTLVTVANGRLHFSPFV
jgi:hypothetical protein